MSAASALWLTNLVLALFTFIMARDIFRLRGRRAREERGRFLKETVQRFDQLPSSDGMKNAWCTILTQSAVTLTTANALVAAICALERANDVDAEALRTIVAPQVNLVNQIGEFVDEGLVRPKDIARLYPKIHANLLDQLALMAPFIWYESILQGRGRWGYRALRLKAIFEQLRPVSPRAIIRGPLVLEIGGLFFLALPSVTPIERAWAAVSLSIRSPTISARSKVAQARERSRLEARLQDAGVNLRRAGGPATAVDW